MLPYVFEWAHNNKQINSSIETSIPLLDKTNNIVSTSKNLKVGAGGRIRRERIRENREMLKDKIPGISSQNKVVFKSSPFQICLKIHNYINIQ